MAVNFRNIRYEKIKNLAIVVIFSQLKNVFQLIDYQNLQFTAKSNNSKEFQKISKELVNVSIFLDSINRIVVDDQIDKDMTKALKFLSAKLKKYLMLEVPEEQIIIENPHDKSEADYVVHISNAAQEVEQMYKRKFTTYFEQDYKARHKKQQELFIREKYARMIEKILDDQMYVRKRVSSEEECCNSALKTYSNQIQFFKDNIEAYSHQFQEADAIYEDKLSNLRNMIQKQEDRTKFCVEEIKRFHFEITRMILRLARDAEKPKPKHKKKKYPYPPEDETEDEQLLREEIMLRCLKMAFAN